MGREDVQKCYHCGNCSAVCPFSKEPYIFPRRPMRFLQMGLEKKLEEQPRAVALLLLRRVLRGVPRGARARRDHDEPAALAHQPVRFHRHLPAVLPVGQDRAGGRHRGGAADRAGVRALGQCPEEAASTTTTARTPSCPAASIHIFDWVPGGSAAGPSCSPTAPGCGGSRSGGTRACTSRCRST